MTNTFRPGLSGILNIDKPPGVTSRDAVNVVQRIVRPEKAGHAGTLDPLATGVLVVAVGAATRLVEYVQQQPKLYRAAFLLGRTSDTEDITGEVIELASSRRPPFEEIQAALPSFTGEILQRPPAFSALKVQGRRAYDLARQGKNPTLAPRPIVVYALRLVAYEWPALTLEIECGSGTYVRSLGRDLAQSLGTGAVMSALVREAIGPFRRSEALAIDRLDAGSLPEQLLPLASAVSQLPTMFVTASEIARIRHGQAISRTEVAFEKECAALDQAGNLVAILGRRASGEWSPLKNFAT